MNDALLCAAYGRAYRCMRSIRELAARGEADDALVLVRSLVSIVGRSLYVVAPDDPDERTRRFDRWRRSWAEDQVRALDDLTARGFEPDGDRDRIKAIADVIEARGVAKLPPDSSLAGLRSCGATVCDSKAA